MDEPLNSILTALMLLALALSFFYLSRLTSSSAQSMRRKNGIPRGQVIYSDLDRPAQVLYSPSMALSGKPDYIIRDKEGRLIPVEIKSGRAIQPHRGHILQVAAYCLLIEENYHMDVPYGIIVYSDKVQHKIEFDEDLRSDLSRTLMEMRSALKSHSLHRGHSQRQKCRSCSFSSSCQSRLD